MLKFAAVSLCILIAFTGEALSKTLIFSCQFKQFSSPDGLKKVDDFSLTYIVDMADGKSVLMGNAGLADVSLVNGEYGLTFLEQLETGAVQSTTIQLSSGSAVHSRHTMTSQNSFIPSQYYGSCSLSKQ